MRAGTRSCLTKPLTLALAASFKAQGLFDVNPNNVQFFNIFYQALGITDGPTGRRLLQVTAPLTAAWNYCHAQIVS